jgi:hypothetical protein
MTSAYDSRFHGLLQMIKLIELPLQPERGPFVHWDNQGNRNQERGKLKVNERREVRLRTGKADEKQYSARQ